MASASAAVPGSALARRGSALENTTDNFSTPRRVSALKWEKLDWLRTESTIKRQRSCMVGVRGKAVTVKTSDHGAGFGGLMHCGRILCPNCGPRIGADRRKEITRSIKTWRARGGDTYFGTLTLRHHRGQRFAELSKAISACWSAATDGRHWAADRKEHGIVHTLRVWEEKWSIANGWHLHVHFLLYVEKATDKVGVLLDSMFGRWRKKALDLGLDAPLLRAQDLHVVIGEGEELDKLGGYFTKQQDEAESMGWEMSNPNGKARGDSFTPSEILELAVGGDPEMQALWYEYEAGMVRRRTVAWSRGLRDELELGEEKTEQEIADEEIGGEVVLSILPEQWHKLARMPGKRRELLQRVNSGDIDATIRWLRSLGVIALPGEYDFEDESDG